MRRLAGTLLGCLIGGAQLLPAYAAGTADDGAPVTVARARQYDFVSRINGETYRIMVALPLAVSTTRRLSDLTPSVSSDPEEKRKTGGGDMFLRVIDEEVKPFVAARYKIDATHQALWGHSIGALMVLRDEPSFAKKTSGVGSKMRVLVTSAGEEQYRGTDEKRLAEAKLYRMIDNASELAERLGRINGERLTVARYILEGETHISVSHAALTRSLRFAFPHGPM